MRMVFAQIQNVTMKAESRFNVAKKKAVPKAKPMNKVTIARVPSNGTNGVKIKRIKNA